MRKQEQKLGVYMDLHTCVGLSAAAEQSGELNGLISRAVRNTIGDALERSVLRNPEKMALEFAGRCWSFAALNDAVNRIANHLVAMGLHKGDRVAAYGKNSDAYLLLWLACTRAGLVHVPINFSLVQGELVYILRQSAAKALFCDPGLEANVNALGGEVAIAIHGRLHSGDCAQLGSSIVDILSVACSGGDVTPPEVALNDNDVVQILYTSGTTSDPKGAMHTHRSLMAEYGSCFRHLDIDTTDRCLAALPLYHSAQLHVFTMPALLLGAFSYLIESPAPEVILQLLRTERLNSFFAPPTVWISLLRHVAFVDAELQHLDKIYYGASIMPEAVVRELGRRLLGSGLYNCYGQSEIGPLATVLGPAEHAARPTSCGRPVLNVLTQIVDPVTGVPCKPGEQGELVHQSAHLMVGYWDKPQETEEAFAGGWFHSGDLGYMDDDGYIYIVDRIKDVVNTGGVLVASRDVEEVLYAHPAVAEVAVIGVPDAKWIEAITAVVVLKTGVAQDAQQLLAHARIHLAAFKVPKKVFFVEQLPKNTAGKILKRTLRDVFSVTSF